MWPPFCKIRSTIAPNIILQKISQGGAEIWIDGAHSWIALVGLKCGQVALNGRLVGLMWWNIQKVSHSCAVRGSRGSTFSVSAKTTLSAILELFSQMAPGKTGGASFSVLSSNCLPRAGLRRAQTVAPTEKALPRSPPATIFAIGTNPVLP